MNPMDRIWEARAALKMATRNAYAAWSAYEQQEEARNGKSRANRAQAATHLPEDMRDLLGIDRYGSKIR